MPRVSEKKRVENANGEGRSEKDTLDGGGERRPRRAGAGLLIKEVF